MRHAVSQPLAVAVIGASSATGRHVVSTAIERGHTVTACVRRKATFTPRERLTEAVWPAVDDTSALADRMRDKETMEPLITASGLDWTIVRPPKLSNHPTTGDVRVGPGLPIHVWSQVGRADLAAFLLDEAETPRYVRAYPRIAR